MLIFKLRSRIYNATSYDEIIAIIEQWKAIQIHNNGNSAQYNYFIRVLKSRIFEMKTCDVDSDFLDYVKQECVNYLSNLVLQYYIFIFLF